MIVLFVMAGCWMQGKAVAQEKQKHEILEDIVVTATRSELKEDDAPASVSVIAKEDLDRLTFDSIDEAIRYEAGVYDGKLRGLPSGSQTLLMMNGMPLNSGWFGGPRWNNVAVENVERIEIVRGPSSALYGGNAMGGTINIITSAPEEFEGEVKVRVGGDDNLTYGGYVGGPIGEKFSLRLGFEKDDEVIGYPTNYVQRTLKSGDGDLNGGFYMPTRTDSPAWIVGDTGDKISEQWSLNLSSEYHLSDTGNIRFDGQYGYDLYDYDAPHTYLTDADGNPAFSGKVNAGDGRYATVSEKYYLSGKGETENSAYMLTYSDTFGSVDFIGKVGYQHEDKYYTGLSALSGQDYTNAKGNMKEFDTDTYFSDFQVNYDMGSRHSLTTGIYSRFNDFTQGRYELSYYRDFDSKTTGITESTQGKDQYLAAYLQDEFKIIDDVLTLYTGARYDYWEASDGKSGSVDDPTILEDIDNSALSPKLSVVWKPAKDSIIKGSIGKAFRAPTIYDLYRTYESSPGRMVYSNPDLDPETIINYEAGVTQYLADRIVKLGATLFYSNIEDLIYTYDGDDGNSYKDNAGEATIKGVELSASIMPLDYLALWANYTYNDSEITSQDKDPEMEGKRITGMPDRTINTGLDLFYEWFKFSLNGQYVGRIYKTKYNTDIPDVYKAQSKEWLWDCKVSAESPYQSKYIKGVEASLSLENIFDTEYYDYSIGRGRTLFAEVKVKW